MTQANRRHAFWLTGGARLRSTAPSRSPVPNVRPAALWPDVEQEVVHEQDFAKSSFVQPNTSPNNPWGARNCMGERCKQSPLIGAPRPIAEAQTKQQLHPACNINTIFAKWRAGQFISCLPNDSEWPQSRIAAIQARCNPASSHAEPIESRTTAIFVACQSHPGPRGG